MMDNAAATIPMKTGMENLPVNRLMTDECFTLLPPQAPDSETTDQTAA